MSKKDEIFLIDSNSFMTPFRFYYAFDLVPAYWKVISKYIESGRIVVLDKVKSEIDSGGDQLAQWINERSEIVVVPSVTVETIGKYQEVMQYIQTCGLYKESAVHTWAQNNIADPWLVAAASSNSFTLVTEEVRSGGLSVKNQSKAAKIPDVADHFGVSTINIYEMMRRLNIVIN